MRTTSVPYGSAPATSSNLAIATAPVAPKVEWRRAWRAVRRLMADPDQTEMAFEAIAALSGKDWERLVQRFAAHPDGRALLAERRPLISTLADLPRLRAMHPDSFGRAYVEFMEAGQLTAQGLVEAESASEAVDRIKALDPQREWLADRVRDMHDLWHVLTGYGRDEAGEAANLVFSFAQMRLRGMGLIILGILLQSPLHPDGRRAWYRYLYRAWQRGRRAAWLPVVRYEDLLPQPLELVRRSLGIEPAHEVHTEGVIVANGLRTASAPA